MSLQEKNINAVFEGGGVKGIGLVGAAQIAELRDYTFEHVAGTSAGAIVASLLAAGYSTVELHEILNNLDYTRFKDGSFPVLRLLFQKGLYKGDYFEHWLRDLLVAKGVKTYRDLVVDEFEQNPRYRYRLAVVASDITNGDLLVLPEAAPLLGIKNPDDIDVATSVRMSMSIPYFFKPVVLNNHFAVDGGVLSNYPVWLYDERPETPTIGFKLVDPQEGQPRKIKGLISLFSSLFSTMLEAHDKQYIEDKNFARTVPIKTLDVKTTEFDLSRERAGLLFDSGYAAAQKFFDGWDYEVYLKQFAQPQTRSARLAGEASHSLQYTDSLSSQVG